MAATVNRMILQGHLGRDPETRFSNDGTAICNVSIATQRTWKDKDGQKAEEVEWHRVVFYGKQAELVGEHAKKGESLYIEGRLKTRKWQDRESGADKFSTEIIAEAFKFNSSRSDSQGDIPPQTRQPAARPQTRQGGVSRGAAGITDMDDDIPFACPRGLILYSL